MGFTTGFIGGLTATYTLLYLSLHLHRSNRQHQSLLLTQQKGLLTSIYEPTAIIIESPAYEIRKAGLAEVLKDRWNRELENMVRNLQTTDWDEVRVDLERKASNMWANVKSSDVGKEVTDVGQRISDNVGKEIKDVGQRISDNVGKEIKDVGQRISDNVVGTADELKKEVKESTGQKRLLEIK